MGEKPVINIELCNGCGLCLCVCARGGLVLVNNVVTVVETVECDWCTLCEAVCSIGAIRCPFDIVIEDSH